MPLPPRPFMSCLRYGSGAPTPECEREVIAYVPWMEAEFVEEVSPELK